MGFIGLNQKNLNQSRIFLFGIIDKIKTIKKQNRQFNLINQEYIRPCINCFATFSLSLYINQALNKLFPCLNIESITLLMVSNRLLKNQNTTIENCRDRI